MRLWVELPRGGPSSPVPNPPLPSYPEGCLAFHRSSTKSCGSMILCSIGWPSDPWRTQSPPCSLSTGPGVETSVQIGIPLLLSPSHVQLFATLWTVRLLCPWDCPGKNTGEGCHFLLQGIFPDQESNLLLAGRFFTTEPPGKPNRDPTGVKLMCDIRDAPQVNPRDLFLYCFEYQGGCCCPFFCRAIYANDFFHAKLFKYLFPYPVDMLYPDALSWPFEEKY